MSFDFDASSGPSLDVSYSNDYGMEENRLSSLKALPQAKRRRDSSGQAQNDNSAISLLTDAPPRVMDSCVSLTLPSEVQLFPWTMNYPDLLELEIDDDCISEALPHAKKRTPSSAPQHNQKNAKTLLENQALGKSRFHRQILAGRVLNSIGNLRVFYEKISNMAGLEADGYGDSEGLPQAKKQEGISQPPNDDGAKFEDSVPNLQVCNRDRQFGLGKLDVVSSENHVSPVGRFASGKSSDEGSWPSMCQSTKESLTETLTAESPISRIEEGGESKNTGEKGSASTVDLQDLLSSLQSFLCILKDHEETEQILRAKMQALREKKEALHLEKQQYKDKYKRQRVSQCSSSVPQKSVRVWLAERD